MGNPVAHGARKVQVFRPLIRITSEAKIDPRAVAFEKINVERLNEVSEGIGQYLKPRPGLAGGQGFGIYYWQLRVDYESCADDWAIQKNRPSHVPDRNVDLEVEFLCSEGHGLASRQLRATAQVVG